MKKSIVWHLKQADTIAIKKTEKLARTILRNHPHLHEFVMCMGTYFFTAKEKDADGNSKIIDTTERRMNASYDYYIVDSFKYFRALNDFIADWDDTLKITGTPMRFTAKGKIKTNW